MKGIWRDKDKISFVKLVRIKSDCLYASSGKNINNFKENMFMQESGGVAVVFAEKHTLMSIFIKIFLVIHDMRY